MSPASPDQTDRFSFGTPAHRAFLCNDAARQFRCFDASLRSAPGYHVLALDGSPLPDTVQELHSTTRLVHSYALGKLAGHPGSEAMVDQGMAYLWQHHRDREHGGYLWALDGDRIHDDRKLAYGHAFVLLAGASALNAGHPDATRLIDDVWTVLDTRYWQEDHGLFADEWNRDWTPFSTYRGMNANMHATEALLTAHEATGREEFLTRAGRILDFFVNKMAASENNRLPEHYTEDWQIDRAYGGDPMFRPAGTTPGHSFELARLLLQYWDLTGQSGTTLPLQARALTSRALQDAWNARDGGFFYTLNFDGTPAVRDRYWWPVTEAIGTLASFLKLEPNDEDAQWYNRLWAFADRHFIDHENGGWFPEIDAKGQPAAKQFNGKPDIYHSIQASLFPLASGISRQASGLGGLL